jgi:hypothetical protein
MTHRILLCSDLDVVREDSQQVDDPIKCCTYGRLVHGMIHVHANSHPTHLKKVIHDLLHATQRAMYSTVNNTTRVVSNPNHTEPATSWNAGMVSKTVTSDDRTMRAVVKTCTRKADCEEVGSSRSEKRSRFHFGCVGAAAFLSMTSKDRE